jgi:hypothetical protein
MTARCEFETLLLDDIEPYETEVADILLDEIGNVVVTDEQQIERHVLAETDELIFAPRELQPATHQQVGGEVREASGLLDRELKPTLLVHDHPQRTGAPLARVLARRFAASE